MLLAILPRLARFCDHRQSVGNDTFALSTNNLPAFSQATRMSASLIGRLSQALLHNARNAGRSVVRRLDAARYWSYFGLFGVRNSTSGMVGNGGSSAKRRACRAARRAVRAASFFVASGLGRIGCSEKGCSMGCPWNAVSVCWAGFQAVMTMRVFCKRGNRFRCPCRCKDGAGCTGLRSTIGGKARRLQPACTTAPGSCG